MVDVIVSGHICLDLLPSMGQVPLSQLASPGKLFEVDKLELATGGAVANTGLALRVLGVDVGLMGKVGDDLLGQVIIAALSNRHQDLARLVKVEPDSVSSYTVVLSPANSDRIFLHCTGTNATFGLNDVDFEQVQQAKIFHLGYPPLLPRLIANDGEELTAIFKKVHAAGVITSMDMAMPDPQGPSGQVNWPVILEKALPYTDIFLPSVEEITMMLRRSDYDAWQGDVLTHITRAYLDDLADELLDMGAIITGFKLGKLGFYVRATQNASALQRLQSLPIDLEAWQGATVYHPTFAVEVVGTTGAGDAAYGAFLAALLNGFTPAEAVQLACGVGACNVEKADATSGLRPLEDTLLRMKSWEVSEHSLAG